MPAEVMTAGANARMTHPASHGGTCRSTSGSWLRIAVISSTCSRQKNGAPGASEGKPPTRELACVGWITAKPRSAQNCPSGAQPSFDGI